MSAELGPTRAPERLRKFRITMGRLMLVIAAFGVGLAIRPRDYAWLALLTPAALLIAPLRNWAAISLSLLVLAFCILAEIVLGEPVTTALYLPVAIVLSGAIGLKRPIVEHRGRFASLIAVNAMILALLLVPWTTRKPFLHHLYSIKPGMSVAEVRKIMSRYMVDTKFANYSDSEQKNLNATHYFRHSDDPMFNADFGMVTFQEGKVINVEFLPD